MMRNNGADMDGPVATRKQGIICPPAYAKSLAELKFFLFLLKRPELTYEEGGKNGETNPTQMSEDSLINHLQKVLTLPTVTITLKMEC